MPHSRGAPRLAPEAVIASPTSPVEIAKREAARRAVDEWVTSGMSIGVGSGSTIVYSIQRLAERMRDEKLDVLCVPTSFQSRNLLIDTGLPLADLSQAPELDVALDGADEVDPALNCIKGGGACQTQEKLVAAAARKFVVVADNRKQATGGRLLTVWRKGIPLEVLPLAHVPVMRRLEAMGGVPKLRMAVAKAGPVVTDNGNFVVDVDFGKGGEGMDASPQSLHAALKLIPGVVETGIFAGMACAAYFGKEDGTVEVWPSDAQVAKEAKETREAAEAAAGGAAATGGSGPSSAAGGGGK